MGYDWGTRGSELSANEQGIVPIFGGMSRLRGGMLENYPPYALFEACLEVDPEKELVAFVLHGDRMRGEMQAAESTRFNLFAATGVWIEE